MEFGPSKAQEMLARSTAELLAQRASVERVREVMATDDGVDTELIGGLADQGLLGLMIAEEHGGVGLGLFETALVSRELGRFSAPFDLASAAVRAPLLIEAAASPEQASRWLIQMATGEQIVAVVDGRKSGLGAGAGSANERAVTLRSGALYGTVDLVPGVAQATSLLVLTDEAWWIVPKSATGLEIEHLRTIDETRRWSRLTFAGVPLADAEELEGSGDGEHSGGGTRLAAAEERTTQAALVTTAADSVGACYRAIAIAVDYAKSREQFGRVIASFQAVKHLCAEMIADLDPVQSLLWYAAYAWDQKRDDAASVAYLLKAHSGEVGYDCVTKATQVFGGVGFTWECDMHITFKRVQVDRQLYGRPEEQRELAAAAQGL